MMTRDWTDKMPIILLMPFFILIVVLIFYLLPEYSIMHHQSNIFCKEHGFSKWERMGDAVFCTDENTISDKEVICDIGFYKTFCHWKPQRTIVEVGEQ